jgi:hypothetical protein
MRHLAVGLLAVTLLSLSGCGDLPEPFLGDPGREGMVLRQPPDPRLAIPPPATALLSDGAAHLLADDLATRLRQGEVPAYAQPAEKTDWRLAIKAKVDGTRVVPLYTVLNPQGQAQGAMSGQPVSAAAWASGDPATLQQVALQAAPGISSMLSGIQNSLMRADPNSLYNRAARVLVPDVTGAPGDGDVILARQMRAKLAALGPRVSGDMKRPDITVQGQVRIVPIAATQERVEIQWIIKDAKGREAGRVIQLNVIPTGTLDHYWGDVAVVVAQEASGGVEQVIQRLSGKAPPSS